MQLVVDASNVPSKYILTILSECATFPRRLIFFVKGSFGVSQHWSFPPYSFVVLNHCVASDLQLDMLYHMAAAVCCSIHNLATICWGLQHPFHALEINAYVHDLYVAQRSAVMQGPVLHFWLQSVLMTSAMAVCTKHGVDGC